MLLYSCIYKSIGIITLHVLRADSMFLPWN